MVTSYCFFFETPHIIGVISTSYFGFSYRMAPERDLEINKFDFFFFSLTQNFKDKTGGDLDSKGSLPHTVPNDHGKKVDPLETDRQKHKDPSSSSSLTGQKEKDTNTGQRQTESNTGGVKDKDANTANRGDKDNKSLAPKDSLGQRLDKGPTDYISSDTNNTNRDSLNFPSMSVKEVKDDKKAYTVTNRFFSFI